MSWDPLVRGPRPWLGTVTAPLALVASLLAGCSNAGQSPSPASTGSPGGGSPSPPVEAGPDVGKSSDAGEEASPGAIQDAATTTDARALSAVIGPEGGTVGSAGAGVLITVPAGALSQPTTITITPKQAPLPGSVGQAYDIGPDGTHFAAPVTLAFTYSSAELDGGDPATFALGVPNLDAGVWVALAGSFVDIDAQAIGGQVSTLTDPAIFPGAAAGGAGSASSSSGGGTSGPGSCVGPLPASCLNAPQEGFFYYGCTGPALDNTTVSPACYSVPYVCSHTGAGEFKCAGATYYDLWTCNPTQLCGPPGAVCNECCSNVCTSGSGTCASLSNCP